MRRAVTCLGLIGLLLFGAVAALPAADAEKAAAAPDFQEVYGLIRAHLAGMSAEDLNRTAVQALVGALRPGVSLIGGNVQEPIELVGGPLVKNANLFDGQIAYIRVGRVEEGLAGAVRQAYDSIGTNRVNGVVVDLRFAGGTDYAVACATADLFLKQEKPLLDWGKGIVRSKEKAEAISVPVAVLVNGETARAAEALAAVLRETGAALIIGSRTAGQAMITQEYPLKNGQRLRVASAPVQVGEGTALSTRGVKPDLAVEVSSDDERAFLADPFKQLQAANPANGSSLALNGAAAGTNRTRRARFGEAELVRERRDGLAPDGEPAERSDREAEKPLVRDPALARALDVLRGLALVRQSRS